MSVKELEAAVERLSDTEVINFGTWFDDYRSRLWDQQLVSDLEGGRLDAFLDDVEKEYAAGLAKSL